MLLEIKYVKKSCLAHEPKMGTSGAAAYDLFAAEDKKLKPHSAAAVSIHLGIEIPQGYYGHILPGSELARHHFIDVGGGAIDPDFRGDVNVTMFNHSNKTYEVKAGDRIAQIVFQPSEIPNSVKYDELSKTDRGWADLDLQESNCFLYCLDFLKNILH